MRPLREMQMSHGRCETHLQGARVGRHAPVIHRKQLRTAVRCGAAQVKPAAHAKLVRPLPAHLASSTNRAVSLSLHSTWTPQWLQKLLVGYMHVLKLCLMATLPAAVGQVYVCEARVPAQTCADVVLLIAQASLQAIYKNDPMLKGFSDHLDYRWEQYQNCKRAIAEAEGSLAEFARVRSHLQRHTS
jgi:hypothetical protein